MKQKSAVQCTEDGSVRSVIRALRLLKVFSDGTASLSFKELCQRADLPKSTTHRLLVSMEAEGFIEQESETGHYRMGAEIIRLGRVAVDNLDLVKFARPYMEKLSQMTQNTSNLYVRRNFSRICIGQVAGPGYVRRYSYLGASLPLYSGASGKVLLAYQQPEFLKEYLQTETLERFTDSTITDKAKLMEELAAIRNRGYSYSIAERDSDTASVAAPIFDYTGKVVAAITVSGLALLFTEESVHQFGGYLMDAGREISRRMGCTDN